MKTAESETVKMIEGIGWYGTFAILLGYFLNSFGVLGAGIGYQILNLTGAFGLALVSYRKSNYQLVVLNTAWCLIAMLGITIS